MAQIGRISGQLLKDNLTREGSNLTFDNDLLHLDVNNRRVGINTTTPTSDLDVNGTSRTNNLEVTTQADIANLTIFENTISSDNGILNLEVPDGHQVTYQAKLRVDDIDVEDNVISTNTSNTNLEIRPNGTGTVEIFADTNVYGNIHTTGNIVADGTITIGDTDTDAITFNADVSSNIIPDQDNLYSLGNADKRWADLWVNTIYADTITSGDIIVDNINLSLRQGNIWYVAENGNDTYSGTHQNDPFRTIKKATEVAESGDTIYVYPGSFEEIFPITVPAGVTIKGTQTSAVVVVPTVGTNTNDAIYLNGDVSIEDISIKNFFYDAENDTGYAFKFAETYTPGEKSILIRNVNVTTHGSVTSVGDPRGFDQGDAGKGAFFDGSVSSEYTRVVGVSVQGSAFITPGVDAISVTNGATIEWVTSSIYYANKGFNAISGTSGLAATGRTKLKITDRVGAFAVGDTILYYDTDATTLLASGIIAEATGDYFYITGKSAGFETVSDRVQKSVVVAANSQISTTQYKFSPSSLKLNGSSDYISIAPHTDFGFGTNDFTVELEVYLTALGSTVFLTDFRTASSQAVPTVGINTDGSIFYFVNGTTRIISSAATITTSSWYHVAVSRTAGETKLFVNGTQVGAAWADTTDYVQTLVVIGANYLYNSGFVNGYIDEVRVSKGVSRYTNNFTQPAAQFIGDRDTVLLLHFSGSNASTDIQDDNAVYQDIRTNTGSSSTRFNYVDYKDFGTEIKSIDSSISYGNYGFYGTGDGVLAYLTNQDLMYIGSGKDDSNNPTLVIQSQEVVELNRARVYRTTINQSGDFRIGTQVYVDQSSNDITFNNVNITVSDDITFTDGLGNTTFIDATTIETGDIRVSNNTIRTLTSDFNIIAASDQINLQNNVNISGNLDVVGNVTIAGNIYLGNQPSDLISFTGRVSSDIIPSAPNTYSLGDSNLYWSEIYVSTANIDNILIQDNVITTKNNADLTLQADGTGIIYIPTNNVEIDNDLTVNGTTYLQSVEITGTLTQTGDLEQTGNVEQTGDIDLTGNLTVTGYGQYTDIRIENNIVSTTLSNHDLKLQANGTGRIYVPTNNVEIDNDLTVNGFIYVDDLDVTTTITANQFSTGDILIDDNYITTTISNNDLRLLASGTGRIYVPTNNVEIDNDLTVNGTTYLQSTEITGTLTQVGDVVRTGDVEQTGDYELTGNLTVDGWAQFTDVRVESNVVSTTLSNHDLKLQANGTGKIYVPVNDVQVDQNLTVVGTTYTTTINNTNTVTSNAFTTGDILIDDNYIATTIGGHDLRLAAHGTGKIYVPTNDVQIDNNLTVNGTTYLTDTYVTGSITQTGNVEQTGDIYQTGTYHLTGSLTVDVDAQFSDISISGNVLTTTISNNDLRLEAAGTGRVYLPNNDVQIDHNLTVVGTTYTSNIENTYTVTANRFTTGNVQIESNTIQTTVSNSNLQLLAAGTGFIELEQFEVQENEIRTDTDVDFNITPHGTGIVSINSTQSIKLPVGTTEERPLLPATGMIRFNTTLTRYEGYNGVEWIRIDGVEDSDGNTKITAELYPGANDDTIRFYSNGSIVADLNSTRLNVINVNIDSININNNIVSTTTTDTNLLVQTSGTGVVKINNFSFSNNTITNTTNNGITVFNHTGDGYLKIAGTSGFVIPFGTTEERPSLLLEEGLLRFNTTDQRVEIFDGEAWISAVGSESGVTVVEAQDIAIEIALALG